MDYYSILGVNKNASDKDIRSAYKKQSMKHHPDRGGNEEEFKKINEAYSTLKDPQKRAAYDNPQPQFNGNPFGGVPPGFEDIFSSMFGQQRQAPRRNPDITIKATITIGESLQGKKVVAAYKLRNGMEETVDISIPAGVRNGDRIRYHGLGENFIRAPRGDLFVKVEVVNQRNWQRENDDLYHRFEVNVLDLLLGCSIIITTLDDKQLEIKVPQGTKPGTTFSVSGYGAPNVRTQHRGVLYVKVDALVPKIDDEKILNKIRDIKDEISNIT